MNKKPAKFEYNTRLKLLYFVKRPAFYWSGYGNCKVDFFNFSDQQDFARKNANLIESAVQMKSVSTCNVSQAAKQTVIVQKGQPATR